MFAPFWVRRTACSGSKITNLRFGERSPRGLDNSGVHSPSSQELIELPLTLGRRARPLARGGSLVPTCREADLDSRRALAVQDTLRVASRSHGIGGSARRHCAMNRISWATYPFAIHVSAKQSIAQGLVNEAGRIGAAVVRLDLSGVADRKALCDRLAHTFAFPHATQGLDAALDMMSDLDWLGNTQGYLVIVDEMDMPEDVIADFAGILPAIVDRWRAQGRPFVVVFVGEHGPAAQSALAYANRQLEAAATLAWAQPGTGAVTIVDHETPSTGR